jgi:hypothetical protein
MIPGWPLRDQHAANNRCLAGAGAIIRRRGSNIVSCPDFELGLTSRGRGRHAARLFKISRQIRRHSLQTFGGPTAIVLVTVAVFLQKSQRRRPTRKPRLRAGLLRMSSMARSAASTQESQMKILGPAMSFATSPGRRLHQLQTASGVTRRQRQICHQLPPAALTTC